MSEEEKYEQWENAKWEDYKDKIPKGISEFAFLHLWLRYGIEHNYLSSRIALK